MAKDALSNVVPLTTATNSYNTTATPLNLLTGSPESGFNYNFLFTYINAVTAATGAGVITITPVLYKATSASVWEIGAQGTPFTVSTATSGTATYFADDSLMRSGHNRPFVAAGIVASIGAGGGGLSVVFQVNITPGREDTA